MRKPAESPVSRKNRFERLLSVLRCPMCERPGPAFEEKSPSRSAAWSPTGKIFCLECTAVFPVEDGIADFLPGGVQGLTLAQWSGQTVAVAWLYERVWRRRALGLLTGEPFPPEREWDLLKSALADSLESPPNLYLDLGCSTGYYGRATATLLAGAGAGHEAGCVVGVDLSLPMLRQARAYAREAGTEALSFWLRADASRLPLIDDCAAGLACGGSLNEYRDPLAVLVEGDRVLKPIRGRWFVMNLLKPDHPLARAMLAVMTFGSGLRFFSREELSRLFSDAGLSLRQSRDFGLVAFSELRKDA